MYNVQCIYIHARQCTPIYIHARKCTCTCIYIHARQCTPIYIHARQCTPIYIHARKCTCTCIYIHARQCTPIYIYASLIQYCLQFDSVWHEAVSMVIGPVVLPLLQYVCLPRPAATCGLRGTCEGREPCWARRPVSSLQRNYPEWRYSLRAQLHLQLAGGCRLAVITSPLPPSLPPSFPPCLSSPAVQHSTEL